MLNHISWTTYLLSMLVVVLIYYLWFGLRFYRKTLIRIPTGRKGNGETEAFTPKVASVMGEIADEPEQVNSPDELSFGESTSDETADTQDPDSSEPERLRLMMETEALIRVVAEAAEPKEHFQLLAGLLTEKYATVADEMARKQVNERFLDPSNDFAFKLKADDLNKLWREPLNV